MPSFCSSIIRVASYLNSGTNFINRLRRSGTRFKMQWTVSFCCHVFCRIFCTDYCSPLSRARLLLDLFQSSSFCSSFCFFFPSMESKSNVLNDYFAVSLHHISFFPVTRDHCSFIQRTQRHSRSSRIECSGKIFNLNTICGSFLLLGVSNSFKSIGQITAKLNGLAA